MAKRADGGGIPAAQGRAASICSDPYGGLLILALLSLMGLELARLYVGGPLVGALANATVSEK